MDEKVRSISKRTTVLQDHETGRAQGCGFFQDNLEHLQALEQEMLLRLELAELRSPATPEFRSEDTEKSQEESHSFADSGRESLEDRLKEAVAANRERELNSLARGIPLLFSRLCASYSLDEFERLVVLLLFVFNTSTTFKKAFSRSPLAKAYANDDENEDVLTIGSLLAILCRNYREQVANRSHFSIEGRLIHQEIIILLGRIDETTNILTQSVHLHERIVRFILGDDCFYDSCLKSVLREKSEVSLDQVIMPEQLKSDVARLVLSFAGGTANRETLGINTFYGYGTGLVLLFYGPSGTGKTMLAKALANKLDKVIFTIGIKSLQFHQIDDVIKYIFKEARLRGGIVFFDECDDIFAEDAEMSRLLLIEIEKADCITILATNKPFRLDHSLERRITMKVPFVFPNENLRRRIWQELVPRNVRLDPDVNFDRLARNYNFNGGLIKNTLFAAVNKAIGNGSLNEIVITMDDLVRIADQQSISAFAKYRLGMSYAPKSKIEDLPLRASELQQLKGLAGAWQRLRAQDYGLNVMVKTADLETGVAAVEATARACDLAVRKYSLSEVLSDSRSGGYLDPQGQVEVSPLEYAFAAGVGHNSVLLFVDHDKQFAAFHPFASKTKPGDDAPLLVRSFLEKLRYQRGFVFVVTAFEGNSVLFPEFHQLLEINYPPEDLQICRWRKHLKDKFQERIIDLVENTPMHLREIDFVCGQAAVRSTMLGEEGLRIERVIEILDRYREIRKSPILFGTGRKS
jgi:Cdc6-like AAA superfamily ATPase